MMLGLRGAMMAIAKGGGMTELKAEINGEKYYDYEVAKKLVRAQGMMFDRRPDWNCPSVTFLGALSLRGSGGGVAIFENCSRIDNDAFWQCLFTEIHLPALVDCGRYPFEASTNLRAVYVDSLENPSFDMLKSINDGGAYGGFNVYARGITYVPGSTWTGIPYYGTTNIFFHFANGVVRYSDGAWTFFPGES